MFKYSAEDISKKMEQCQKDLKEVEQLRLETENLLALYNTKQKAFAKSVEAAEKSMDEILTRKHINTLPLNEATRQIKETQMSFNLQYLQLQSQMQHENRAYTAVSNIMKTKHDTVKNSIGNVR